MKEPSQQVVELLKAFAHPTRLAIIKLLSQEGPLSVSNLQTQLGIEQSLMSHYLLKMRDLGILSHKRQGKTVYYDIYNPVAVKVLEIILKQSVG